MAKTSQSSRWQRRRSSSQHSNRRPRKRTLTSATASIRTSKMRNATCAARPSERGNRRRQSLGRSRKTWSLLNCRPSRALRLEAKTGFSQDLATKLRNRKARTRACPQTQWKRLSCRPSAASKTIMRWTSRRRWPVSCRRSSMLKRKMMTTMMKRRRTKKN